MAHRATIGCKSIFSRGLAWLAVYAFVLQTVLAPIAAAAATTGAPADAVQLVLCAEHPEALGQDQNQPIAPHDHEVICKFCVGCPANALLAPDAVVSAAVAVAVVPVRWHAASFPGSGRHFLGSKQARGPPTLT